MANKSPGIAGIVTDTEMSLLIDGSIKPINNTFPNFSEIRKSFLAKNYDKVRELLDLKERIISFVSGKVEIRGDDIYYEGNPCHNVITRKILELLKTGRKYEPLCRFLENVKKNKNKRIEEELYTWLEAGAFHLTDDGCFLAYKRVRDDYMDFHTGTFDNHPGRTISMPMKDVDPDSNRTCSIGFHFCSKSYLPHFKSEKRYRDVMVKVNPAHVGAFPKDFGISKGRCSKYYVVQEIGNNKEKLNPLVSETIYKTTGTMTKEEAVVALGIHNYNKPMNALKRRLDRGVSVKRVWVDGKEMAELQQGPLNKVMTFERAMTHFKCSRNALRKRISRGKSVDSIVINGVEVVILIDSI